MRWGEISVTTTPVSAEAVANILLEAGCEGVAEKRATPLVIKGFLPETENIQQRADAIKQELDRLPEYGLEAITDFKVGHTDEKDWANAWRDFYKPMEIGRRLVIKPTWEPYSGDPERVIVEIDPGMAFGTGEHGTTRLCLAALEELVRPGMVVADIGTGSGILALAAARLGAGLVHATDIDSLPRKIARENVEYTKLGDIVRIEEMDEFDAAAHDCDLVVANILADVIIEILPTVTPRLKPGGLFICSGIVEERAGDVLNALRAAGYNIVDVRSEEYWRAIVSTAPTGA